MRSPILENWCGSLDCWGAAILQPTQPEGDFYHLLRCYNIYIWSLSNSVIKHIGVVKTAGINVGWMIIIFVLNAEEDNTKQTI